MLLAPSIDLGSFSSEKYLQKESHDNNSPWATKTLMDVVISSSPPLLSSNTNTQLTSGGTIFPPLPPLLDGHPDVHLRNGIMNASRSALAHELNAEQAFFVADLGQVYRQHQRWKSCLPEIQPFYGSLQTLNLQLLFYAHNILNFQPSNVIQTHMSYAFLPD